MKALLLISAASIFFGGSVQLLAVDPPSFQVSTAFGLGADAQLNEHNNNGVSSGSSGDLNTRTSANGDRNEIVALRFDLSEHTLANLAGVTLNIVNFRNNSARQVALYGVKQGALGGTQVFSTDNWDETGLFAFGDMPGLTETDGDFTTQNLNPDQVTFLGQITFSNLEKGSVETFADPAITAFLRSYTGSPLVTFLLAAPPTYTSTGEARFASKEATALDGGDPTGEPGQFAPYLSFQTGGLVAPSVLITRPANGADFPLGTPIEVEVEVSHNRPINRVEFYAGVDDVLEFLGEDSSAPYTFSFAPSAAGTYTIQAVAADDQGFNGLHSVTVDVGIENPPEVAITSPADGAVLLQGAPIIIAATATDDVSVAKVEFYAGAAQPLVLLGEDTTAPFTIEFTPESAGVLTLQAVATDNLGLTNSASILVNVQARGANYRTVSTAAGLGADAQANEHTGFVSGLGNNLNTRTSVNGDRNEIVALRFDLSEYNLADLGEVTLNIVNYRNNSAREVALYGVRQGATGGSGLYSTEDWDEIGLAFDDLPGLLLTDGDFTTQSIDETKVVPLGQITFANLIKGTIETFSDPALTDFVRAYTGSKLVTFLLAAAPGYTSTGEARFASRESFSLEGDPAGEEPGQYAPYLAFTTGAVSEVRFTSIVRNANELVLQWSGGAPPYTIQQRTAVATGVWTEAVTGLSTTAATVPAQGNASFFRVIQPGVAE